VNFVNTRLSVMMFLQYAVWGIWLPQLGRFLQAPIVDGGLGFTPTQVGWIVGAAGSVGALTAPFAGQIADRHFSTERVLAALLILGGVIKWLTALMTGFWPWLGLSIAYSILYMPTLGLSNSLAFAHMKDAKTQFPIVRVWGTIGWIAAAWAFPLFWLLSDIELRKLPPFYNPTLEMAGVTGRLVDALKFSAVISFGYAVFCLFLPNTPPKRDAVEPLAYAKAFALFRRPSLAVLLIASLMVSVIHYIYFSQTSDFLSKVGLNDSAIMPAMSVGQFAEIFVMILLGFMLKKLGFRWVIAIGALAYFARYLIWGMHESFGVEAIVGSQALHGFCYSCFFAAAFIYVDRMAGADVRHSAQTIFGMIILGLGPILVGPAMWILEGLYRGEDGVLSYAGFWTTLGFVGLAAAVLIAAMFRDETEPPASPVKAAAAAPAGK
jgi:nucleoside transporter